MKLIILGIDALNHELINKCKEIMPNLHGHLHKDCAGILETTLPYFTGPTWVSFQTGKNVANHGFVNFFNYDEDMNISLATGNNLKENTFYELADDNNYKCFIMNLPYTYPARINGDIVYSWLYVQNEPKKLCYPEELVDTYPSLNGYINYPDRSRSTITYLNTAYEVLETQERVIKEVLSANEHDVYFFLIAAADMVQHKAFGEIMDDTSNKKTKIGKKILEKLDKLVGWIDNNKDEDTIVLIASDHGFKVYDGKFLINSWLKNKNYLVTSKEGKEIKDTFDRKKRKKTINLSNLISFVKRYPLLFKFSEHFYDFITRYLPFDIVKQAKIDFKKTKAFCRSSFENIIFLNTDLQKAEKEKIKNEIISKLNKIDGIKAHDSDVFYKGKYRSKLGDIAVTSEKYEIDNTVGTNEFMKIKRSMHNLYGTVIAYGKGINKKTTLKNAHITDITPTILHILNIPIPNDMDGKVLTEMFEEKSELGKRSINIVNVKKIKKEKNMIDKAINNIKI